MRTVRRPRRYVAPHWIVLAKPVLRYSEHRDAYLLRGVGRKWGPVVKLDRRRGGMLLAGATERRGAGTF